MLGVTKAQQGNHLVVQGYNEILDVNLEPYSKAVEKTTFFDIDFNSPEIDVKKIVSKRQKYPLNRIDYMGDPEFRASPGYLSISNSKGKLLSYIFDNVLYNNKGDSVDFIPQYGGYHGFGCDIRNSDTFTLYYISSKKNFNKRSFDEQFYNYYYTGKGQLPEDSIFIIEAKYFEDRILEKKRIKGFDIYGKIDNLQSNLALFKSNKNELKLQFVWDGILFDVNITNDYKIQKRRLFINNSIYDIFYSWWDSYIVFQIPEEITISPSGRWTVFNLLKNTKDYYVSKVYVIDNNDSLSFKVILSDSAVINNGEFNNISFWKRAVCTKYDSIFMVLQIDQTYRGWNKTAKVTKKIVEIHVNKNLGVEIFDIKIDSIFTGNDFIYNQRDALKDFTLGPNGKSFVFLTSFIESDKHDSGKAKILSFHLAELKKINGVYTIENPIKLFEGADIWGDLNWKGYDEFYDKIYFPATPTPYHYINFTNKSICNKFTHEFTNETDTNWFDHFMWFWGDGDSTASHKSQPIVRHQYPKPGKYRVNLKSITAHGGWVWYSDSVEVLPEPIAKYQTKNTVGCQWIAVRFNDSSVLQKKNHTWYWDFGDGTDTILQSSNGIMPSQKRIEHTYSSSGKFNVQLRITDGRCTDTFSTTQNIDILPAPRPGISIDKTTGCTPLEVRFARTYSDQTDSTIYHFKSALNPNNRFNGSQNTAVISKSGPYMLHQKLYGPSGCVTEDSVSLQITQGILPGTKPQLKRSTVVNNRTVLTDWNPVPHAKDYQVYRNGQPHAVATDTQFIDYLNRDIDRTYIYEIIAKDSCGNLASAKSNIGKPIFLQVKQIEPASKSEFATALLTWTPYEDWSNSGGVENYSIFGNYAIESQSWQLLKNQTDTQLHDPDFIAPPNYEKCYRINAKSLDGRYQTQSNVACLDFPATLFAPNSFTPNGDGLNDAFEIFNYGFDRFTMTIYNSWGQKVFDQTGPTATWHPSKDIPQGVYVYQIKAVRNEKEFNFSGTVSLLR